MLLKPPTIKGTIGTGGCKTVHETSGAAEEFPFVSDSNQHNQHCHVYVCVPDTMHACMCVPVLCGCIRVCICVCVCVCVCVCMPYEGTSVCICV